MSSSQWSLNFWIWWISSRFSFCEILFDTTSIRSIAGTGLLEHIFQPCRPVVVVVVVVSSRRRVDFWLRIDSMCPSRTIRVLSGAVGRRLGLVRQRPPPGRVELRQRAEVGFLFFFLSNLVSFGFGIRLVVFFIDLHSSSASTWTFNGASFLSWLMSKWWPWMFSFRVLFVSISMFM